MSGFRTMYNRFCREFIALKSNLKSYELYDQDLKYEAKSEKKGLGEDHFQDSYSIYNYRILEEARILFDKFIVATGLNKAFAKKEFLDFTSNIDLNYFDESVLNYLSHIDEINFNHKQQLNLNEIRQNPLYIRFMGEEAIKSHGKILSEFTKLSIFGDEIFEVGNTRFKLPKKIESDAFTIAKALNGNKDYAETINSTTLPTEYYYQELNSEIQRYLISQAKGEQLIYTPRTNTEYLHIASNFPLEFKTAHFDDILKYYFQNSADTQQNLITLRENILSLVSVNKQSNDNNSQQGSVGKEQNQYNQNSSKTCDQNLSTQNLNEFKSQTASSYEKEHLEEGDSKDKYFFAGREFKQYKENGKDIINLDEFFDLNSILQMSNLGIIEVLKPQENTYVSDLYEKNLNVTTF